MTMVSYKNTLAAGHALMESVYKHDTGYESRHRNKEVMSQILKFISSVVHFVLIKHETRIAVVI